MKNLANALFLLSLVACSDWFEETYSTYAEASRAGAVKRGWVPNFVPASATDIIETHNIDTGRQTLRFTIPPTDVAIMVQGFQAIEDRSAAVALATKHGLGPGTTVYLVCSRPVRGALAVDGGHVAYDTTVPWAAEQCSST